MKHLSTERIDVLSLWKQSHHPAAGGVVLFSGEVRNNHQGREVSHLHYEAAEPMADKMIAALLDEATHRWGLQVAVAVHRLRSEEHTSELQSLMRISYAVFCLKKKNNIIH